MQIDVGCVPEGLYLLLKSLVDSWMAVTDGHSDDPSEHVEVPSPLVVPQPLHATLMDEQGGPVVGGHGWIQVLLANLLRPFHRRPFIFDRIQWLRFLAPVSSGTEGSPRHQPPRRSNEKFHGFSTLLDLQIGVHFSTADLSLGC